MGLKLQKQQKNIGGIDFCTTRVLKLCLMKEIDLRSLEKNLALVGGYKK